jgi:hypothetical protein
MGVFGTVAMVMVHIVAFEAGHPFLQPVDASFDAFVVALIIIGHAGAVAGYASVPYGCDFLDLVALEQTAFMIGRPADMALATGGMALAAMVVTYLLHGRVAEIGPTGGQRCSKASQVLV